MRLGVGRCWNILGVNETFGSRLQRLKLYMNLLEKYDALDDYRHFVQVI